MICILCTTVFICEVVQIRAVNSMIRLRYPNITPCEMMFYRTSSARHDHTSLQHPCPLSVSLAAPPDCELQNSVVLCLGLHVQPSCCSSAAIPRPLCPPHIQLCPADLSGSASLRNRHELAVLGQCHANRVMLLAELD